MARPLGKRLMQVLEIVQRLGACSAAQVYAGMLPMTDSHHVHAYCTRAVGMGLMIVDRRYRPTLYTVAPDWREIIVARAAKKASGRPSRHSLADKPLDIVAHARRTQPSSVFTLAGYL